MRADTDAAGTAANGAARHLPDQPVPPADFAHAVLRTAKYREMIDWYRTVLGARVVFGNDVLTFLSYDEEHHRLAVVHVPGMPDADPAATRLAHLAYSYRDLGSLLGTYRRLKALGILPYRPINHGPTVSLYYRDPDGTAVELQVDAFPTKAEAARFFESDAFRENPIGVAIDPDALLAAYESGAPEAELLKRPAGPPSPPQR
jgi:catechol 2,3-dioxygenase-like lactoylglutathione lyase family enzyme